MIRDYATGVKDSENLDERKDGKNLSLLMPSYAKVNKEFCTISINI